MSTKFTKIIACGSIVSLSACMADTPLTPAQTQQEAFNTIGAKSCVTKGYVTQLNAVAFYIQLGEYNLQNRAAPEAVADAVRSLGQVNPSRADCRQIEIYAIQTMQNQQRLDAQNAEASQRLHDFAHQTYYPPRSNYTSCTYVYWGNSVLCN